MRDPLLFACTGGVPQVAQHSVPKGRLSQAMIYPEADKLEDWGSKYALVALAAKRAKQLKAGAPILVDTQSRNPLTVALEEIAAGRIICTVEDHDTVIPSAVEPVIAELLPIPAALEDEAERTEADGHEEAQAASVTDADAIEGEELIEEEDEEEARPLGTEDVWKEVMDESSDESSDDDTGMHADLVDEPEAVEVIGLEAAAEDTLEDAPKPKRRGRRPAASAEPPVDLSEEASDVEVPGEPEEEE